MEIFEIEKMVIFIAFVVPGFISLKIYDLYFPDNRGNSTDRIIDAIAYSSIIYAILYYPIRVVEKSEININHPFIHYIFYIFVFIISPILLVIFWKKIRLSNYFSAFKNTHPTQKPWDYVFSNGSPYFIKVFLKNGLIIGGVYSSKSFTSSAPADEQIYLEETWIINENGGFDRAKKGSAGVIILHSEISHLELINYVDNPET